VRAQRHAFPADAQKKNGSPTGNPGKKNPNKKPCKPDIKQNNQPRELNKEFPLIMPLMQKTAKAQQKTLEAQLRHKNCTSPTRNQKKFNGASPTKS
jgi:hypothetical protein